MFCQIFHSPQVNRCAIITYKHAICEMPHELPNDLILGSHGIFAAGGASCPHKKKKKILGSYDPSKLGNIRKVSKFHSKSHRMIAQPPVPPPNVNFANTSKKPLKNRNQTLPALRYSTPELKLAPEPQIPANDCSLAMMLNANESNISKNLILAGKKRFFLTL